MQASGTKIFDKHNLTLGITSCGRYCGGTQFLRTILEAQTTSEHAIARGILEDIGITAPHHIHVTGNHVCP